MKVFIWKVYVKREKRDNYSGFLFYVRHTVLAYGCMNVEKLKEYEYILKPIPVS